VEVQIRQATTGDEQAFLDLSVGLSMFNRAHRDFGPLENHLEDRIKRNGELFRAKDEQQLILLAELSEETVGYALCNYFESRGAVIGYLDELYVKEEARGLGAGRRLMHACVEWMKAKGVCRVTLNAFSFNEHALAFYEMEGFHVYALSLEKHI